MSEYTEHIVNAFKKLEVENPEWLRAIENRPTGSQWGRFMPWQELAALPWQMLPESDRVLNLHSPQCEYYFAKEGLDPNATDNIKLLSEFSSFASVYIRHGAHGDELVSPEVKPQPTSEAWLILGPSRVSQQKIVYTAYPGRFATSVIKHPLWDGTYGCLKAIAQTNIPVAVKGLIETG